MDTYTIIGIAVSLCAAGLGVGLGLRILSLKRKSAALIQSEGTAGDIGEINMRISS